MNRHDMLGGLGALAFSTTLVTVDLQHYRRAAAIQSALRRNDSLAYCAARAGLLFGTMLGRNVLSDRNYMALVAKECSLICATLISPFATYKGTESFTFQAGDEQVAFARKHRQAIDGGYLIVHGDEPRTISALTSRSQALEQMQLIISTTMDRYKRSLDHWIVVNEAVGPNGLRNCLWLSTIGPEYIGEAFKAARRQDPDAVLVLNENHIEDAASQSKRNTVLALVRSLIADGVPIDALGLQAHLDPTHPIDQDALSSFLRDIKSLGLSIMITELDVIDSHLAANTADRDRLVADCIESFLRPVVQSAGLLSVSVWGLSDGHSWLNEPTTPRALKRSDGLPSRGCLFDADLKPKAAYFTMRGVLTSVSRH